MNVPGDTSEIVVYVYVKPLCFSGLTTSRMHEDSKGLSKEGFQRINGITCWGHATFLEPRHRQVVYNRPRCRHTKVEPLELRIRQKLCDR
jgi:hypothetical protein